ELGQTEPALAAHADAIARAEAMRTAGGTNDHQHFHGRALLERGQTLMKVSGGRAGAEQDFDRAVAIWDDLQARYPQYPLYREWLAGAHLARGEARAAADRPGPASDDLARSRQLLETLVREFVGGPPSYHSQ